jgi:hypothetical protein
LFVTSERRPFCPGRSLLQRPREMDVVSESVKRITGKPAPALEPFLRANPELWEKLAV